MIRVRMSQADAHYAGDLVDGARVLALFGDVATELCVRDGEDEGLFRAYEEVEFLAPVHAGDFIEADGEIVARGKTSRKMRFEARKVIAPAPLMGHATRAVVVEPAVVVCRAVGTCVIPKRGGGLSPR